ncbi:hypothetical protein DE4585_03415 [Mycobacteroides salmoniphilum]|uniref:Uncharacterized protein n=1 Tax=Mycobacteroides salmoniphilum TaxID=404941 RepID=A0A4R8RYN5_9MYCO|nr:hypothetical protein DE4585_03415 [Mycobacteroides salmoniphilum]
MNVHTPRPAVAFSEPQHHRPRRVFAAEISASAKVFAQTQQPGASRSSFTYSFIS